MKNRSKFARLASAAGILAIVLTATACNTVKGLGRDIQSAGQAGEDTIKGN